MQLSKSAYLLILDYSTNFRDSFLLTYDIGHVHNMYIGHLTDYLHVPETAPGTSTIELGSREEIC